jgi:hypothetical protein
MDSCNDTLAGGLPHSDIHGSTPARGSPWLFAACHVLHRLLVPRHPPNALLILDTPDLPPKREASPCTETILSFSCHGTAVSDQSRPRPCPSQPSEDSPGNTCAFRTQQDLIQSVFASCLRKPAKTADQTRSFTAPLNPRRRPLGHCSHEQPFPVRHTAERRDVGPVVGFPSS